MALIDALRRHRRFFVFCAVGGSGVVINMAVFAATLKLWPTSPGPSHTNSALLINVAGLLGWFVSVGTNYLLNERLTFADRREGFASSASRRLARYYISATAALAVQLIVLNGGLALLESAGLSGGASALGAGTERIAMIQALIETREMRVLGEALLNAFAPELCNLLGIAAGTIANYLLAKRWVFH